MTDLRYPIGEFKFSDTVTFAQHEQFIAEVAEAPVRLRAAIVGLSPQQLDTPYRPGGWTVRQVVHHVPDSHMNSYVRFKLALTEDEPLVKTYEEQLWSELPEARTAPVDMSLQLLEALHARWVAMLRAFKPGDWQRKFRHPALGTVRLEQNLALYAWHGRHHVAHITALRERMGW